LASIATGLLLTWLIVKDSATEQLSTRFLAPILGDVLDDELGDVLDHDVGLVRS
jgi:hypothetical protein